jgi:hypothetical protein
MHPWTSCVVCFIIVYVVSVVGFSLLNYYVIFQSIQNDMKAQWSILLSFVESTFFSIFIIFVIACLGFLCFGCPKHNGVNELDKNNGKC